MKAALPLALALVSLAAAAAPPQTPATEFSGSVWEGQSQVAHVDLALAPDRPATISAGASHSLELTAHRDGSSLIRLLDSSGKAIHTAKTPAGSGPAKSFRYVICGSASTFSSPEPADIPAACPAG